MIIKKLLAAAVVSAISLCMTGAHAGTRTESANYYGGSGDEIILPASLTGLDYDMGGHEFLLDGDELTAKVTIADESGMPVGSYYSFRDADDTDLVSGTYCNTSSVLTVPPGSNALLVFIDEAFGPTDCTGAIGAGVAGTITVDYTN